MMKKSRYNSTHKIKGQTVLYNAYSERLCVMDDTVARLYETHEPDELQGIHPSFYDYLKDNEFIVPTELDEVKKLIDSWNQVDTDATRFNLSVNPTLNCNMHCWYCYENHRGDLGMKPDVLQKLKMLIARKVSDDRLKYFSIGFFGGEPLLNFDKIGRDIIDFASAECSKHNVKFSLSFVTNGSLLTDSILDFLDKLQCRVVFQITIDGNRACHNQVRKINGQNDSYDVILENCAKIAAKPNMSLTLRCNFTAQNIASFLDVASDFKSVTDRHNCDMSAITIDLHQVWQDVGNRNNQTSKAILVEQEDNVRAAFARFGFNVNAKKSIKRYRCYADQINHALVNFDGNIFRCTARDFTDERAEGVITPDGEIEWNDKSKQRDEIKWKNPTCADCLIYPICSGNCSQSKLESSLTSGCYFGYSEQQKQDIIRERVEWLIAKSNE